MTKKYNHFLGKAGHLAIMSEFLVSGWNVFDPEVQLGVDIFAVDDNNGTLRRIRVDATIAVIDNFGFCGDFQIPIKQLETKTNNFIHYVFIVRYNEKLTTPIIIRQDILLNPFQKNNVVQNIMSTLFYISPTQKTKLNVQDRILQNILLIIKTFQ